MHMHCATKECLESGFSLIELLSVIVLIGILTVTIAPRFMGKSDLAGYALRDQFISSFRYAQQRAMYDHSGNCYRLNVGADRIGPQRGSDYLDPIGEVLLVGDYDGISISPQQPVFFDGLGNAYSVDCNDTAVANPLTFTIQPLGLQVEIFPTGFIRAI